MTRLTIDLPPALHKTLKSIAVIKGETMRNIAISALERYAMSKKEGGQDDNISEDRAEAMLKPLIEEYVTQIQEGTLTGSTWEDFKKDLQENHD